MRADKQYLISYLECEIKSTDLLILNYITTYVCQLFLTTTVAQAQ